MAVSDRRNLAFSQLDRLQDFFPRAEGKATYLFTINLGMAGILAANLPLRTAATMSAVPALIALGLLGWSTVAVFRSLFPQLDGPGTGGLVYFGDIASMTSEDFGARFKASTDEAMLDDALGQVWRNAEILRMKYDRVSLAFRITGFALPFWLLFLSVVTSHGAWPTFKVG